jgi:protein-S-isoprenylcysteine O-methyltransferase Ste14
MSRRSKNLFVTLTFTVLGGPGILGVYIPAWITGWRLVPENPISRVLGVALIAIGLAPLFDSILRFIHEGRGTLSPSHPTETLVSRGLYRFVRNPMYLGVLTLIAGQLVLFQSWALLIYFGCVAAGFHLFVVLYEEPTLRKKYGTGYEGFCHRVPRWIPRIRAN